MTGRTRLWNHLCTHQRNHAFRVSCEGGKECTGSGAGGASKDLEFCWNPCCGGGGSWGGSTCCLTEPGFTEKGSADSAFLNLFSPYRFNISLGNHSLWQKADNDGDNEAAVQVFTALAHHHHHHHHHINKAPKLASTLLLNSSTPLHLPPPPPPPPPPPSLLLLLRLLLPPIPLHSKAAAKVSSEQKWYRYPCFPDCEFRGLMMMMMDCSRSLTAAIDWLIDW